MYSDEYRIQHNTTTKVPHSTLSQVDSFESTLIRQLDPPHHWEPPLRWTFRALSAAKLRLLPFIHCISSSSVIFGGFDAGLGDLASGVATSTPTSAINLIMGA